MLNTTVVKVLWGALWQIKRKVEKSAIVTLYLLILMAFLTHIGFAGSRLAVPLFAVDQGGGPFVTGTIVALYAALPAVLALPVGRAADRIGYRPLVMLGTSGIFIGLLAPSLFPSVHSLYFVATLLGVSFMTFQLAVQTLVGGIGSADQRSRNYSLLSLGYASANFSGPLIAGVMIDHLGYVLTFLCLSVSVLCAVVLALSGRRWIPQVQAKAVAAKGGLFDLLKIKTLRNTLIASGIVSSAWDVYQFFMPIYGRSLGMSATAIGLVVSAFAISIVLIRLALPLFVRRIGETQTLTYAMFIACGAFCLFPLFSNAWLLAAVSFLLGVGCGVGQPLSMTLVYNASPKGREGEAAGMRITVNQVAHFLIPLAFGALGSLAGYSAVFLTNAVFLFGGGVISRRVLGRA